jgi:hypothetical protein
MVGCEDVKRIEVAHNEESNDSDKGAGFKTGNSSP